MGTRRVLVFDNDRAFLDLLQNSLGAHGFEVQVADPGPDDIYTLKTLNPEVVFIAVETPDKVGYTLCSKAKKALGKKILIVLTTASLSRDDLALHQRLRLHADVYLDKRSLSRDELLHKLDKLIGLGPRIGALPPKDDKDLRLSTDVKQISIREDGSDKVEGSPAEVHEATDLPNQEVSTGGKPTSSLEPLEETTESEGDANRATSGQKDVMGDQTVKKYANGYNDLDGRLAEQESQIAHLRRQLEESRRDARSSPFSSEFVSLRERMAQKDSEIIRLTEKLHDSNRETLSNKKKLREFEERMAVLKREKDQGMKQEKGLKQQAADMLTQERQAHQQTRQRFESKIIELQDQHAAAVKQAELEKHSALDSVQKEIQKKLANVEEGHQHDLNALEKKHAAEIAQLQSEKKTEIEALKRKAAEETQQAADMLTQERQAHQQIRQRLEAKIAELQDQHAAAMKQAKLEKHSALDSVQKEIQKKFVNLEEGHQHDLNALKKKHAAEIAQLQNEKKAEIEALKQKAADMLTQERQPHQQTRQRFESKIIELQDQHAIRDTEIDLLDAEEDHQHLLKPFEKKYVAEIFQLQDEKNEENEELEELTGEECLEELDV